jgi:hypothetical protein
MKTIELWVSKNDNNKIQDEDPLDPENWDKKTYNLDTGEFVD